MVRQSLHMDIRLSQIIATGNTASYRSRSLPNFSARLENHFSANGEATAELHYQSSSFSSSASCITSIQTWIFYNLTAFFKPASDTPVILLLWLSTNCCRVTAFRYSRIFSFRPIHNSWVIQEFCSPRQLPLPLHLVASSGSSTAKMISAIVIFSAVLAR